MQNYIPLNHLTVDNQKQQNQIVEDYFVTFQSWVKENLIIVR